MICGNCVSDCPVQPAKAIRIEHPFSFNRRDAEVHPVGIVAGEEVLRVRKAKAIGEKAFFFTWPHHCAVGTKPPSPRHLRM
jgi:ferredoxin